CMLATKPIGCRVESPRPRPRGETGRELASRCRFTRSCGQLGSLLFDRILISMSRNRESRLRTRLPRLSLNGARLLKFSLPFQNAGICLKDNGYFRSEIRRVTGDLHGARQYAFSFGYLPIAKIRVAEQVESSDDSTFDNRIGLLRYPQTEKQLFLCRLEAAHFCVQQTEIRSCQCDVGMQFAQPSFTDFERAPIILLSFNVFALLLVNHSKIVV